MAFSGHFDHLNLYPEYLYHHMNSPEGEWDLGLSSASDEIGAKFHSRDETREHLVEKNLVLQRGSG